MLWNSSLRLDGPFARGRFFITSSRPWYFPPINFDERAQENAGLKREAQAGSLLSKMPEILPALTTLVLDLYAEEPRDDDKLQPKLGVPLPVFLALFSIPLLRHFSVMGRIFHPTDDPSAFPVDISLPPLVSFEYTLDNLRSHPRASKTEMELLNRLIPRLHLSLETLHIPSESAPLRAMYNRDWPRLHTFSMYGQRRTVSKPLIPYILLLARMPGLRTLHLLFANPEKLSPQPIWPRGFPAAYPWRKLEELTVTQPHAEDELWCHLPSGLRYLSLRCWPRRSMILANHHEYGLLSQLKLGWHTPLLSTAEMYGVLLSCNTPNLTYLDIEYRADSDNEGELLEHIAQGFPSLEVLQLRRYHPRDGEVNESLVSDTVGIH